MLINTLTLLITSIFTGATLYINLVEHPARIKLDNKAMLQEWKFGIKRATVIQGSLAIMTFILAYGTYATTHDFRWLIGGTIMLMNWPYTLLFIMPTNKKLILTFHDRANDKTKFLINRWNKFHAIRTLLGLVAIGIFLFALAT